MLVGMLYLLSYSGSKVNSYYILTLPTMSLALLYALSSAYKATVLAISGSYYRLYRRYNPIYLARKLVYSPISS